MRVADAGVRQVGEGVLVDHMQIGGDVVAEPELCRHPVTPLFRRALQNLVEHRVRHRVPAVNAVEERRQDERPDPPIRRQQAGLQ